MQSRVKITPRMTENNTYAKCGGDKQKALWYVMVFSVVVKFPHKPEKKETTTTTTKTWLHIFAVAKVASKT